jgi:hypothetical protein
MLNFRDVFFGVIVIFCLVWCKRKKLWVLAAKIPGHDGLPVIGILTKFVGVKAEGLKKLFVKIHFNF